MLILELIDELNAIREIHGDLPVIMWTGGDVDILEVGFDTIKKRHEVWLVESSRNE